MAEKKEQKPLIIKVRERAIPFLEAYALDAKRYVDIMDKPEFDLRFHHYSKAGYNLFYARLSYHFFSGWIKTLKTGGPLNMVVAPLPSSLMNDNDADYKILLRRMALEIAQDFFDLACPFEYDLMEKAQSALKKGRKVFAVVKKGKLKISPLR